MPKDPIQPWDPFSFIATEGEVSIAEVGWIDSIPLVHSESAGHLENKKSLQNLAQSWELWIQALRGANTRCRHHQGIKSCWSKTD